MQVLFKYIVCQDKISLPNLDKMLLLFFIFSFPILYFQKALLRKNKIKTKWKNIPPSPPPLAIDFSVLQVA